MYLSRKYYYFWRFVCLKCNVQYSIEHAGDIKTVDQVLIVKFNWEWSLDYICQVKHDSNLSQPEMSDQTTGSHDILFSCC